MSSKTTLFKSLFLGGCAILTLTACAGYEESFYSYDHPADNYYQSDKANIDNYSQYYQNQKPSHTAVIGSTNKVSKPHDIDIAYSEPAAAPQISASVPQAQFIPEGSVAKAPATPAMIGSAAPAPTPVTAPTKDFMITGCPSFDILPDMRAISFFKGGNTSKLVADATIQEIRGSCSMGNNTLEVSLKMLLDARIGDYGRYQTNPTDEELQSYPYFVALINKATGDVEYKKIFAAIVRFPSNTAHQNEYEDITAYIPVPTGQDINNYALNIGFQLNSEQLNYNRGTMMSSAVPVAVAAPAPSIAPMASAAPANNTFMTEPVPAATAPAQINIDVENSASVTAMPASAAPSTLPSYAAANNTSMASGHRFLQNRPRVSQDPLKDAYSDTLVK